MNTRRTIFASSLATLSLFSSACSKPSAPKISTDSVLLAKQINLPDGVLSSSWIFEHFSDDFPVPSPGTSQLVATLTMSPEAMTQIKSTGDWKDEPAPEAIVELLTSPNPPARLLHNTSVLPQSNFIRGRTWQKISLFADPATNTIYFIAEKS